MKLNISEQIFKALTEVSETIEKNSDKVFKESAKKGQKMLEMRSQKRTGAYAKGWIISNRKKRIILHNIKKPGLTHLLEKGHRKKNGGRVKPYIHIEPVQEYIVKDIFKQLENLF